MGAQASRSRRICVTSARPAFLHREPCTGGVSDRVGHTSRWRHVACKAYRLLARHTGCAAARKATSWRADAGCWTASGLVTASSRRNIEVPATADLPCMLHRCGQPADMNPYQECRCPPLRWARRRWPQGRCAGCRRNRRCTTASTGCERRMQARPRRRPAARKFQRGSRRCARARPAPRRRPRNADRR